MFDKLPGFMVKPLRAILLFAVAFAIVAASPPASVTLTYFRGESRDDGAHLEWQTATELDTAGFRIRRASNTNGPFGDLQEIGIVPAQGSATSGSTYEAHDATAESGQRYWYQLVEMEYDGSEHALQTIELFIGATPTATVEGIATTDTDEATPEPTASAVPATAEPSPSSTSPVKAPTNTPDATVTRAQPNASPTASPEANVENGIGLGSSGEGIAEAAEPTAAAQPTRIAQATEPYPGATVTGDATDDAYPTSDEVDTAPTPAATPQSYPPGVAPAATAAAPNGGFENTVGATGVPAPSGENATGDSPTLSRILLWVGFTMALLIFISGAIFSIVLSTRKQRRDI